MRPLLAPLLTLSIAAYSPFDMKDEIARVRKVLEKQPGYASIRPVSFDECMRRGAAMSNATRAAQNCTAPVCDAYRARAAPAPARASALECVEVVHPRCC